MGGACSDKETGGQPLKARVAPGVELFQDAEGFFELRISSPIGSGSMRGRALSSGLFAALVDFTCTRCPNVPSNSPLQLPSFSNGVWLTVNLCWEGRCEVDIPDGGLGVVAAGDLCASYSRKRPAEFRYPSGRYRGVELFVNERVAEEPAFSLLGKGENAVQRIAREAGPAAVIANDTELNGRMEHLAALLDANDDALAKYEILGLLLGLQRRDLSTAKPRFLLTRAQMGMAAAARDEMERALGARHDARTMAAAFGVSAASLNEYFARAYGSTIAAYLRRRRMEEAVTRLAQGAKVTEAAAFVGYANPSKFAAAFKKAYGVPPREWRRESGVRPGGV